MADGRTYHITGVGKVKIEFYNGSELILSNVRHAPGTRKNLILLGSLDDLDYKYKGQGGVLKLSEEASVVMKGCFKMGHMFCKDTTYKMVNFRVQNVGKLRKPSSLEESKDGLDLRGTRARDSGISVCNVGGLVEKVAEENPVMHGDISMQGHVQEETEANREVVRSTRDLAQKGLQNSGTSGEAQAETGFKSNKAAGEPKFAPIQRALGGLGSYVAGGLRSSQPALESSGLAAKVNAYPHSKDQMLLTPNPGNVPVSSSSMLVDGGDLDPVRPDEVGAKPPKPLDPVFNVGGSVVSAKSTVGQGDIIMPHSSSEERVPDSQLDHVTPALACQPDGSSVRLDEPMGELDIFIIVDRGLVGQQPTEYAGGLVNFLFSRVEARGFSGGIWVFWKSLVVQVPFLDRFDQALHMEVMMGRQKYLLTGVYGHSTKNIRQALWDCLDQLSSRSQAPWLVIGDFNEILDASEKRGGALFNPTLASRFREVMERCGLLDMGSSGPCFTWIGQLFTGLERIFKRLDRALCNAAWRTSFSEAAVRILHRILSDHHPILLDTSDFNVTRRGN
ncbi:hypothetical protein CRG98_030710 [Punica granatum]|uniref:Endonuclease/exonuclease/phosphatase domain-containing protein n=1 Tax=Punica granatum TaxID=22663 RepID=A0A2I0IXX5_PUNGR|nr:hypothetical protein CRG98_030710 [Punica granatum]